MEARRRTQIITLTFLTGAAVAVAAVMSDDDDDTPRYARNENDCVSQTGDAEACRNAAQETAQEFETNAPRFTTKQACEQEIAGDCRSYYDRSSASGWFIPAMTGFMIGRMFDNGTPYYRVQSACQRHDGSVFAGGCGPVRGASGFGFGSYVPANGTYAGNYRGGLFKPEKSFSQNWSATRVAASRLRESGSGGGGYGSRKFGATGGSTDGITTVRGSVSRGGFGGSHMSFGS